MHELHKNTVGLIVGSFAGLWHAVWAILVATGSAKPVVDWALNLHHISVAYTIAPFDFGPALFLVLVAFLIGFAVGWIFTAIWNGLQD